MAYGFWFMVSDFWFLIYNLWFLVSGFWFQFLVYVLGFLGIGFLILDSDFWFPVSGFLFPVYGVWFLIPGSWILVSGLRFLSPEVGEPAGGHRGNRTAAAQNHCSLRYRIRSLLGEAS